MSANQKKILKKLKRYYKSNNKYFAFLADYLFKNGYDQQAQDILEQNCDKYPDYTSGWLILGEIFYSRKEYLKAEEMFKKVLEVNKKSVKALKYLANIESLRKNKKAQFDYLTDALRYDAFDQDAKNFILMYSGLYSDEKVVGSSYFSERMSQLLDKDIVNQAIEGSNSYKSTYDLEEISRIALEEKEKLDKEAGIINDPEDDELTDIKLKDSSFDGLENEDPVDTAIMNEQIELEIKNEFKHNVEIVRDKSDEFELSLDSDDHVTEEVLEEFERELEEMKTISNIEIPVPDDISEIFESNEISESESESQNFEPLVTRIPLKDVYSPSNKNLKTLEKYSKLLDKAPDNLNFRSEFLLARSAFIKQRLMIEVEYYRDMQERYPANPKYGSKLRSFLKLQDTVDDYNLKNWDQKK
ncbi:MAG: hypothetical protein JXR69_00615 [Candidatus Delongbacteria bacterium]|nr:hypothetical protein [Candidatus Delongbacteria bacterium]